MSISCLEMRFCTGVALVAVLVVLATGPQPVIGIQFNFGDFFGGDGGGGGGQQQGGGNESPPQQGNTTPCCVGAK